MHEGELAPEPTTSTEVCPRGTSPPTICELIEDENCRGNGKCYWQQRLLRGVAFDVSVATAGVGSVDTLVSVRSGHNQVGCASRSSARVLHSRHSVARGTLSQTRLANRPATRSCRFRTSRPQSGQALCQSEATSHGRWSAIDISAHAQMFLIRRLRHRRPHRRPNRETKSAMPDSSGSPPDCEPVSVCQQTG